MLNLTILMNTFFLEAEYLQLLAHLNKCCRVSALLKVKIAVSHYILANDHSQISSEKPLVFVLDNIKEEEDMGDDGKKRKKRKKHSQTAKNKTTSTANSFGSVLKISQFKGNPKFVIGFRARLGSVMFGLQIENPRLLLVAILWWIL